MAPGRKRLLYPVLIDCNEWPGRAAAPPSPLIAVRNVTAYPSTASVPTLYYLMLKG